MHAIRQLVSAAESIRNPSSKTHVTTLNIQRPLRLAADC